MAAFTGLLYNFAYAALSGLAVFNVHRFFFCPITDAEGIQETEASKVARLYKQVRKIKESKLDTKIDKRYVKIRVNIESAFETMKIIGKLKYQNLLQYLYAPTRLQSSHLYVFNYYLGGKWYKALVNHQEKVAKGYKITTSEINGDVINVTEGVRPYMGPADDFYQCRVTPIMLGFNNLTFEYFALSKRKFVSVTFNMFDVMDLSSAET